MTKDEVLAQYPKIFAKCRTLAVDDGWLTLLDTLCHRLQYDADHNEFPQVVAIQVKEKFGGLRFYVSGANDFQRGLIELAQDLSLTICDQCGNAGEHVSDRGYEMTRCPAHIDADRA